MESIDGPGSMTNLHQTAFPFRDVLTDIAEKFFRCTVPLELHTDLSTENGVMAGIQSFFMSEPHSQNTCHHPISNGLRNGGVL